MNSHCGCNRHVGKFMNTHTIKPHDLSRSVSFLNLLYSLLHIASSRIRSLSLYLPLFLSPMGTYLIRLIAEKVRYLVVDIALFQIRSSRLAFLSFFLFPLSLPLIPRLLSLYRTVYVLRLNRIDQDLPQSPHDLLQ